MTILWLLNFLIITSSLLSPVHFTVATTADSTNITYTIPTTTDVQQRIARGLPTLIGAPQDVLYIVRPSKPARFTCQGILTIQINIRCTDGQRTPAQLIKSSVTDAETGLEVKETSTLIKRQVVDEHFSDYWCQCILWGSYPRGKGANPPKFVTKKYSIKVAYLRRQFESEPLSTERPVGSQVQLRCRPPRGVPPASIKWLHNGQPVNRGNYIVTSDGNLLISRARFEDSGNYTCVATNLAQSRQSSTAILRIHQDGAWSPWQSFGKCSSLCGTGYQTRKRTCTAPVPRNGGANCTGSDSEKQLCNTPCPLESTWSSWGLWSTCGITSCKQHRRRRCNAVGGGSHIAGDAARLQAGARCRGVDVQSRNCTYGQCKNRYGITSSSAANNAFNINCTDDSCAISSTKPRILAISLIVSMGVLVAIVVTGLLCLCRSRRWYYAKRPPHRLYEEPKDRPLLPDVALMGSGAQQSMSAHPMTTLVYSNNNRMTDSWINVRPSSYLGGSALGNSNQALSPTTPVKNHQPDRPSFKSYVPTAYTGTVFANTHTTCNPAWTDIRTSETCDTASGTGESHYDDPKSLMNLRLNPVSALAESLTASLLDKQPLPTDPKNILSHSNSSVSSELFASSSKVTGSTAPTSQPQVSALPSPLDCHCPTSASFEYNDGNGSTAATHGLTKQASIDLSTFSGSTVLDEKLPADLRSHCVASASGVFTALGGRLSIPSIGLSVTVPADALAGGVCEELFVAVCRDGFDGSRLGEWLNERDKQSTQSTEPRATLVSPLIVWGPAPSVSLKKPVVLSFAHCACPQSTPWQFELVYSNCWTPCNTQNGTEWTTLVDVGNETINTSAYCQVDERQVHVMCDTPGRLALVGRSPPLGRAVKRLRVAVFATATNNQDPNVAEELLLRVYLLDDTLEPLQTVTERERQQGGLLVDEAKLLHVHDSPSGVCLRLSTIGPIDSTDPTAVGNIPLQEVPFEHVWSGSHRQTVPAASFTLIRHERRRAAQARLMVFQKDGPKSSSVELFVDLEKFATEPPSPPQPIGIRQPSVLMQSPQQIFRLVPAVRQRLCEMLDPPNSLGNDWRMLAKALGFDRYLHFAVSQSPTSSIFDLWEARNLAQSNEQLASPMADLRVILQIMGREDCSELLQT